MSEKRDKKLVDAYRIHNKLVSTKMSLENRFPLYAFKIESGRLYYRLKESKDVWVLYDPQHFLGIN